MLSYHSILLLSQYIIWGNQNIIYWFNIYMIHNTLHYIITILYDNQLYIIKRIIIMIIP